MNIQSVEQAYQILHQQSSGVPFEAIKYLQTHADKEEFIRKFQFAIVHSEDDLFLINGTNMPSHEPLWLAVVAEKIIDRRMIAPIIERFSHYKNDYDFLDEQLIIVLYQLVLNYPDELMDNILNAIERSQGENERESGIYWLLEPFYFVDLQKYKERILNILKLDIPDKDNFIMILAENKLIEVKPYIEKIFQDNNNVFSDIDLQEALDILDGKKSFDKNSLYSKFRGEWEEFYKKTERYYDDHDEEDDLDGEIQPFDHSLNNNVAFLKKPPKIGRNEPCPCGSGLKYKRCCGS